MKKITILTFVVLSLFAIGVTQAQGPTARAVTQTGTITTGVTVNADAGLITTVSSTLAAVTATTFTVTDSRVEAGSVIVAKVNNYSGTYVTNGIPIVNINNVVAGAFDLTIVNVHASNALSGVLKIGFHVK
jgi:hypothetical protein